MITFISSTKGLVLTAVLLAFSVEARAQDITAPQRQSSSQDDTVKARTQRLLHGPDLEGKDGPMAKVGTQLTDLYVRLRRAQSKTERRKVLSRTAASVNEETVAVDAVATGSGSQLQADLKDLGLVRSATAGRLVSGLMPVEMLPEASRL